MHNMAKVKKKEAPKTLSVRKGKIQKSYSSSKPFNNNNNTKVDILAEKDITPAKKVTKALKNGSSMKRKIRPKKSGKTISKVKQRPKRNTKSNTKLYNKANSKDNTENNQNRRPRRNLLEPHKDYAENNNNRMSFETENLSSPETLDKNSNRIKKSKLPNCKEISKKTQISKLSDESQSKRFESRNPNTKTKQVRLSNGVVLTLSSYTCDYCNKMFTNKSSLRRHILVHLNLKPYTCSYCLKKFRQRSNLKVHIAKGHVNDTPKAHICDVCDKQFVMKENLELHMLTHVKNENDFTCVYCNQKFSHHLLLTQHEKQHLVSGRYQCSLCNMSYTNRTRLSMHVKSHLNIKEYICQYCGKDFLRPSSIKRHIEISHGGHRVKCPICDKLLRGHLSDHMRTHEKKRPHKCPECGQCFTQSTQLTVHRRCHTGAKPYTCRICDRQFSHSSALLMHIRRHTGEKPFTCALCPMSFAQLPHMKNHMRTIHGKHEAYKCSKCNDFFKLKVDLEEHAKGCNVGDKPLTFEENIQASIQNTEEEACVMTISRMRFLLALLFTMITTKEKLKYLGFNKRLIDDLLNETLEAMDQKPCTDSSMSQVNRLKTNIQYLLNFTVPADQMEKFQNENKTTEELLELLTAEVKN